MPVELDDFKRIEKEVEELKKLVAVLKEENYRLAQPTGIETVPSPPPFPARVSKKRVRVKPPPSTTPTESNEPIPSGEPEPPTDGEPSELLIHFPADPLFGSEAEPPSPATL